MKFLYLIVSFFFVAFGEPAWTSFLGFFAATLGWAFFWKFLSHCEKKFLVSFLFFAIVQGVQLSWLSSTTYQGYVILLVYALVIAILGVQFALFCLFIPTPKVSQSNI
ncbi:MAG: apolipoprotein N-acyltransferase, partial [Chlamydiota bacterium]